MIFKFLIQSYTDVVTNSSSELYVIDSQTDKALIKLLNSIHPNWRDEYDVPQLIHKLPIEKLSTYICSQVFSVIIPNLAKNSNLSGIKYYEERTRLTESGWYSPYKYWFRDKGIKINNGKYSFLIKKEYSRDSKCTYITGLTSKGEQVVKDWFRKNEPNTYALFSLIENPSWESQKKLMEIGTRYHLS